MTRMWISVAAIWVAIAITILLNGCAASSDPFNLGSGYQAKDFYERQDRARF